MTTSQLGAMLVDISLPITGGAFLLVIGGFIARELWKWIVAKIRRWDQHIEDCAKKSINHARLEEKVSSIQTNQDRVERTVGDMDKKLDRLLERA